METRLHYKPTVSRIIFMIFAVAILILIAIACFLPIWHVIMASISDPTELNVSKGLIVKPLKKVDFTAYKMILQYKSLWQGYRNTLMYIVLSCVITGVLTVIAGYVFSRTRFYYRNTFMLIISFTMLFNGGMIPTYLLVNNLHMVNTVWSLLIPGAMSVYNMIITRTFFMNSIPQELLEASQIDGCSDARYFFSILLPLSQAVISVISLYYAVGHWNAYFNALIYIRKTELQPLQLILRNILLATRVSLNEFEDPDLLEGKIGLEYLLKYALIVVSSAPIIALYPFVQKFFMKGVMLGSVKG